MKAETHKMINGETGAFEPTLFMKVWEATNELYQETIADLQARVAELEKANADPDKMLTVHVLTHKEFETQQRLEKERAENAFLESLPKPRIDEIRRQVAQMDKRSVL